jgi:hypothetical protein
MRANPPLQSVMTDAHNRPMTRRSSRPRAYAPDPGAPGRCCDLEGCDAAGEYRAPKSRTALNDYWWFCLDHVRAYNAAWDYYRGMSPGEIEAQIRADMVGQRPTWPLGKLGATLDEEVLRDPFHVLNAARHREARQDAQGAPAEMREPLATLGLHWPITLDQLKTRYKELAKRHHPDANNGDRAAEERLKDINLAYAAVRTRLAMEPQLSATG